MVPSVILGNMLGTLRTSKLEPAQFCANQRGSPGVSAHPCHWAPPVHGTVSIRTSKQCALSIPKCTGFYLTKVPPQGHTRQISLPKLTH